jgi:hypothetical protein
VGVTELAMTRAPHFTAQDRRHQLHAVTDAEDGRAELEQPCVAVGRFRIRHAARPTGQDEAGGLPGLEHLERRIERNDFGVDRQLAQAPRDQLGVLRSEVQNEDGLMHGGRRYYRSGVAPRAHIFHNM